MGVPVEKAGEPRPNEPAFYSKNSEGQTVRCMPRGRAPRDSSQMQRIGRLVQQLEDESARFETMRRADQNSCESALTADECGNRFSVDAAGNDVPSCDFYETDESKVNDRRRDLYKAEHPSEPVLTVLEKKDEYTKLARHQKQSSGKIGICVPNKTEMRRRVSVYSQRLNALLDENNLLRKRAQEMAGSTLRSNAAGGLLSYTFADKGTVLQKKTKAIKATMQRRKNNQEQVRKLQQILRKYLEHARAGPAGAAGPPPDDYCRKIRTTLGDCVDAPGCAVLQKHPNGGDDMVLLRGTRSAARSPSAATRTRWRRCWADHCRAADASTLRAEEKVPKRTSAIEEPAPAFLANDLRRLQRGRGPAQEGGAGGRIRQLRARRTAGDPSGGGPARGAADGGGDELPAGPDEPVVRPDGRPGGARRDGAGDAGGRRR